jgi:hypothetical protein
MVEGKISFGRFRLNIARRDETLVRLGGRARDILCVLASACRGRDLQLALDLVPQRQQSAELRI